MCCTLCECSLFNLLKWYLSVLNLYSTNQCAAKGMYIARAYTCISARAVYMYICARIYMYMCARAG